MGCGLPQKECGQNKVDKIQSGGYLMRPWRSGKSTGGASAGDAKHHRKVTAHSDRLQLVCFLFLLLSSAQGTWGYTPGDN